MVRPPDKVVVPTLGKPVSPATTSGAETLRELARNIGKMEPAQPVPKSRAGRAPASAGECPLKRTRRYVDGRSGFTRTCEFLAVHAHLWSTS